MRAFVLALSLFTVPMLLVRDANADDAGSGSAVVAGSGSSAGSANATAAVTVVVPDPNVDPLGDASAAYTLYKSGAYIPMVIVLAFAILTVLKSKWPALNRGKVAAYIAGGIGLLAALIPAAAHGQTPTLAALFAAVGAAIALIVHPVATEQKQAG